MKNLNFLLFLLTCELFITPNQGFRWRNTKACNQKLLQQRKKQAMKNWSTPWKPEKPHVVCIPKIRCDCSTSERRKPENNSKCHPDAEDNPEKWFVKVFQTPDTTPQKLLFCSVGDDVPSESDATRDRSLTNIIQECKKCRLATDDSSLILKCVGCVPAPGSPSGKTGRFSRKKRNLQLSVKFLQISEPEKSKNTFLWSVMKDKPVKCSSKKKVKCLVAS